MRCYQSEGAPDSQTQSDLTKLNLVPYAALVLRACGTLDLPTSNELKLGVVAALIGAPAFVWIAMRRRTVND